LIRAILLMLICNYAAENKQQGKEADDAMQCNETQCTKPKKENQRMAIVVMVSSLAVQNETAG